MKAFFNTIQIEIQFVGQGTVVINHAIGIQYPGTHIVAKELCSVLGRKSGPVGIYKVGAVLLKALTVFVVLIGIQVLEGIRI